MSTSRLDHVGEALGAAASSYGTSLPRRLEHLVGEALALALDVDRGVGLDERGVQALREIRTELVRLGRDAARGGPVPAWANVQSATVALTRLVEAELDGDEREARRWARLATEPWERGRIDNETRVRPRDEETNDDDQVW